MNSPGSPPPEFITTSQGRRLAYHRLPGKSPGVLFCGGFMSDMSGTKAQALESFCRHHGRAFVRFDYSGHGQSGGQFSEGTIGSWREDALEVFDQLTDGPQVIVGSSMGGWISLLLAMARPERVQALLLLAPAPDFTREIYTEELNDDDRAALEQQGFVLRPTEYGDQPYTITKKLISDGEQYLLLEKDQIPVICPVEIIHGMEDSDVHWQRSLPLVEKLQGDQVTLHYIKRGDHRLSEADDLKRICLLVEQLWHPYPN